MTIDERLADELIEAFWYFRNMTWKGKNPPSEVNVRTAINLTYDYACMRAGNVQPIQQGPEPSCVLNPPEQYVPLSERGDGDGQS